MKFSSAILLAVVSTAYSASSSYAAASAAAAPGVAAAFVPDALMGAGRRRRHQACNKNLNQVQFGVFSAPFVKQQQRGKRAAEVSFLQSTTAAAEEGTDTGKKQTYEFTVRSKTVSPAKRRREAGRRKGYRTLFRSNFLFPLSVLLTLVDFLVWSGFAIPFSRVLYN